ncbi:MAG TPA: dTDP-4-dehydrorhamnose reductase [Flavisolibacter sp.]|nr:dTDP-4-dehydrorhamnose reductase [Flavisolibacter sp.]
MAADKKIILVTGSRGQLGMELQQIAPLYPQFDFVFLSREEASIADKEKLAHLFEKYRPAFLVNCAAYTAVDKAESEKEASEEINGHAVGHLAALCSQFGTRFIHVSTDYVFPGTQATPLREDDPVDPVNTYGATKLLGEQLALKNDPDVIIIRTSWVYSSEGKNFVKTMMRLMQEKERISVVNDQYGSPTYAADLAEAIMRIIVTPEWKAGLYNYSNEGVITWFEFAAEIRDLIHSSCIVQPIATAAYPTPARRPKYSVLDKTKILNVYRITPKDWKESLRKCLSRMSAR